MAGYNGGRAGFGVGYVCYSIATLFFLCFFQQVRAEEEGFEWEEVRERLVEFGVVTCVVLIGLGFETFKEKLEEWTSKAMKPILRAMWGELTGGGFFGLVSFVLTKSGALTHLSVALGLEEDELNEIVEQVHLMLFIVFVLFLGQTILLLILAHSVEKNWRAAEKEVKDPDTVIRHFQDMVVYKQHNKVPLWDFRKRRKFRHIQHRMEYLTLRENFIHPSDSTQQKLDPDFDYSEYLSILVGHTIGDLVKIHPFTWGALECLFFVFFFASAADEKVQVGLFIIYGWSILLVLWLISRKLEQIRKWLLPPVELLLLNEEGKSSDALIINNEAEEEEVLLSSTDKLEQGGTRLTQKKKPPYLELPHKPRTVVGQLLLGPPPNKHEQLFWFDKKGHMFILHVIRSVMMLSAVYVAVFGYQMSRSVWYNFKMQWRFELYILMVVPLLIALFYHMPHIARRYVVCSNIELKKKKRVIDRVVRVVRTRKSIRMLRLLNSIKSYARRMQRMAHRQTGGKPKQTSNAPKQALSPETVREIEQVFQLFDKDGNGRVSASEMVDLMQTLGIDITRETAQEIINEVDVDGDGELDLDEFIEFMRDEISDREKAPEETIEEMFALFDRDASGSISHHEFRTILMALGNALSPEDISELIRELDEDGNGEIDIEEFRHLVHKFS